MWLPWVDFVLLSATAFALHHNTRLLARQICHVDCCYLMLCQWKNLQELLKEERLIELLCCWTWGAVRHPTSTKMCTRHLHLACMFLHALSGQRCPQWETLSMPGVSCCSSQLTFQDSRATRGCTPECFDMESIGEGLEEQKDVSRAC